MKVFILILGVLQTFICAIAFFFKEKKHFLLCNISYNLLLLVQYALIHCYTEMIIVFIDIIRTILFYILNCKNKDLNIFIIISLEIVMICVGVFTFKNWFSIFVITSSMISVFAQWQNNMLVLRVSFIICSILLIINYYCTGLYTAIIAETITLISIVISIIKYYFINSDSKKLKKQI